LSGRRPGRVRGFVAIDDRPPHPSPEHLIRPAAAPARSSAREATTPGVGTQVLLITHWRGERAAPSQQWRYKARALTGDWV